MIVRDDCVEWEKLECGYIYPFNGPSYNLLFIPVIKTLLINIKKMWTSSKSTCTQMNRFFFFGMIHTLHRLNSDQCIDIKAYWVTPQNVEIFPNYSFSITLSQLKRFIFSDFLNKRFDWRIGYCLLKVTEVKLFNIFPC